MADPIGPKFCVGHRMTTGKILSAQNFKKLYSKAFDFSEIKKMREKT